MVKNILLHRVVELTVAASKNLVRVVDLVRGLRVEGRELRVATA